MDDENVDDFSKFFETIIGRILESMGGNATQGSMEFGQDITPPPIEIHEVGDETIILLELPGILEEDLVCDIRDASAIYPDFDGEKDFKVLYISTEDSLGAKYSAGIKLDTDIHKLKAVSVRNGVVEIILV